jgi:hypothetical protein
MYSQATFHLRPELKTFTLQNTCVSNKENRIRQDVQELTATWGLLASATNAIIDKTTTKQSSAVLMILVAK